MARRGSRFNRGRVQRFGTVGQYDYGPSGAITEDFGDVAKEVGTAFQKRVEVAEKAKERIDKYDKEALEGLDFPYTGVADLDRATMSIAQQAKEGLFAAKQRIGTMVEDPNRPGKKKMYTIDDFSSFKNNLLNGAKIYKGTPDLVQKQLESFSENENISDISSDGLTKTLGSRLSTESAYNIEIDDNGNFIGSSLNKEGERQNYDMKKLAMNGVQQVEKFDSIKDIADFQKVYASKQKDFEIDGQTYTAEQVLGNPVLFTKHVEGQAPAFESAKKQYIENFKTDDNKVISYLYDRMGVKLGSKGDEENSIILNSDTGKFEISRTLRNKARDAFALELEGAFGTKTTGKAQILPKDKPVKGATEKKATITPDLKQTFSSKNYPNVGESGQQKSHGAQDIIDKMRAISASRMSADPQSSMNAILNEGISVADKESAQAAAYTAFDTNFQNQNADLFKEGKMREFGKIETKADIEAGKTDFEGVSVGFDLKEADLKEFGLVSSADTPMTGISGISFSYRRELIKGKDSQYSTEVESGFDVDAQTRKIPTGIRLAGNSIIQSRSVGENVKLPEGELTGKTASEQRSQQFSTTVFTNNITDDRIPQLVKMLSLSSPNIQRAFEQELRNKASNNTEAFYKAINSLKVN